MENNFKKVHAPVDLVISSVILLVGIGLFFVNQWGGIVVALCGVSSFLIYKSGWRREGDSTLLRHRSVEMSRNCKTSLVAFLKGENKDLNIRYGNEGGTLLLEVWYTADQSKSYVQLSEFLDLRFQKTTEIIELNNTATHNLLSKL
ncbi:MAG: hypothetical protein IJT04_00440 [Bacteroidales bacterium]|nr:hypothetical protein [Bacteroidales bacterium]